MIYIFCATKSEAQAIVEHKKLQKTKHFAYTRYTSPSICLLVSGIGLENAKKAALFCKEVFDPKASDVILNIGIAAAPQYLAIGSLCPIKTLLCNDQSFNLSDDGYTLQSFTTPQNDPKDHLVDMEACGIVSVFGTKVHIYKVVSDHFQPSTVKKGDVKKLIASKLKEVKEIANS